MNIKTHRPFESAKIEIFELDNLDVVTISIRDPFEGEEAPLYWEQES